MSTVKSSKRRLKWQKKQVNLAMEAFKTGDMFACDQITIKLIGDHSLPQGLRERLNFILHSNHLTGAPCTEPKPGTGQEDISVLCERIDAVELFVDPEAQPATADWLLNHTGSPKRPSSPHFAHIQYINDADQLQPLSKSQKGRKLRQKRWKRIIRGVARGHTFDGLTAEEEERILEAKHGAGISEFASATKEQRERFVQQVRLHGEKRCAPAGLAVEVKVKENEENKV